MIVVPPALPIPPAIEKGLEILVVYCVICWLTWGVIFLIDRRECITFYKAPIFLPLCVYRLYRFCQISDALRRSTTKEQLRAAEQQLDQLLKDGKL